MDAPGLINFYCGGCSILYDPSNMEIDWIRCRHCREWWELDCADLLGKCLACLPELLFLNSVDPSIREGLVC